MRSLRASPLRCRRADCSLKANALGEEENWPSEAFNAGVVSLKCDACRQRRRRRRRRLIDPRDMERKSILRVGRQVVLRLQCWLIAIVVRTRLLYALRAVLTCFDVRSRFNRVVRVGGRISRRSFRALTSRRDRGRRRRTGVVLTGVAAATICERRKGQRDHGDRVNEELNCRPKSQCYPPFP